MIPGPIIAFSSDLTPEVLDMYKKKGYKYIRQIHRPYNHILRIPSTGCIVELSEFKDVHSHLLESPKARKLLRRISYFGYI